ncbi:MAG: hypothetical protein WD334_10290 [Chitinophagales bacterium]
MPEDELVQQLYDAGWTSHIARMLGENIYKYRHSGRSVVFDFDNTIICGDIGEKVLRYFSENQYAFKPMHSGFSPDIYFEGQLFRLEDFSALEYYNTFLSYSALSFKQDPHYKSIPYSWAVQIMEGLSLRQLLDITKAVFPQLNNPEAKREKPFFYTPILKLMAMLQRYDYDIKIITASNVWSVRKIILEAVNPILAKWNNSKNKTAAIKAENIIGLEVLLRHQSDGNLRKDRHLMEDFPDYSMLSGKILDEWILSPNLNFPVTAYEGKPAAYYKHFGNAQPLFCFGDTTSDIDLLKMAEQPVWLARMEDSLEVEKVWRGWNAKAFLRNNVQAIESNVLCSFLQWESLSNETFLKRHPNEKELRKSMEIIDMVDI